jgi:UDP-glucose 4-epimerase
MEKKKKTVLITGNAGFIGSHIADKFIEEGFNVVGIDNLKRGNKKNVNKKTEFYNIDLNNNREIKQIIREHKPSKIIHLASTLVSVPLSIKYPWLTQRDILTTTKMLEVALDFNLDQVIFASSANVYGNQLKLPIKEDYSLCPLSPYGLTKLAIEEYLTYLSHRNNITCTVFRYFNVYGERQSKNSLAAVPTFINNILGNKPITVNGGNQTRDFIYVKDVAEANFIAAKNNISGIFNIGTGKQIKINELIKIIGKFMKTNPVIKQIEKNEFDCDFSQASIKKAIKYLNWKPKNNIEEGIKKTILFYSS